MGELRSGWGRVNHESLARWLRERWDLVSEQAGPDKDPEVDRLIDSSVKSIRYAVLTQLLGKLADPSRDVLCLQRGDADDADAAGRWDARSLCSKVVVPWDQENQSVLGGSTDPYVNNPLRRPRLDVQLESLKRRSEWEALVAFLERVSAERAQSALAQPIDRCLRAVLRRLDRQVVHYGVPPRVSLDQMLHVLEIYLRTPSHGLRALAAASALLRTLGAGLGLFTVTSQGLNEADSATGAAGDILCAAADGRTLMAVEVKDRPQTLVDLEAGIAKAREAGVSRLLFVVPGVVKKDAEQISRRRAAAWAQGIDVYGADLVTLARISFMLVDEVWRREFFNELGAELNRRKAAYGHRQALADLLHALDEPV